MTELRGRLFVGGRLAPGTLRFEGARIAAVEIDAESDAGSAEPAALPIVAPGFIDLHVHGFGAGEPLSDLALMARSLARAGTTAFQPTLFPREPVALGRAAAAVAKRAADRSTLCAEGLAARVVGLHLEGPFVNPERAGALPQSDLAQPSPRALRAVLGSATGDGHGVRTMTVAPELPGGRELVAELARLGIRASLGHSAARAHEAASAVRDGASGVTHLYNAMSAFHHRDVGLIGVAWADEALAVELIGDLVHSSPQAVELALDACGPARLCLVSDALSGAGTGCSVFHANGREHHVRDGAAWLRVPPSDGEPQAESGDPDPDADSPTAGWRLGGAIQSQHAMIRQLVQRGVVGVEDALAMATSAPARALGLEGTLGVLTPNASADCVVLTPALELIEVWIGGQRVSPGE